MNSLVGKTLDRFRDVALTARGAFLARTTMSKTPYFSNDLMREYQATALRFTLIEAYRRVPYYQKLFWDFDFDPHRATLPEGLSQLPVLTKEQIRNAPADFCSRAAGRRAVHLHTSGTTGHPMTAYASEREWIVEQAAIWRHWSWAGYRFRDKMAILRSYAPRAGEPLTKLDRLRNWLFMSPYHLNEETVLKYLQILQAWKPRYLRGYPSSLYLLARAAHRLGVRLPSLRAALTASEVLTPTYRQGIEEAFGIKVFDHYGQAEISTMLHECEQHHGLHVLEDYAYTEFLPTEHPNQMRLIATNLFNEAMPLVRYDTGDFVELHETACPCGRRFPSVRSILGRSDQFLFHKDGHRIPSVNFYTYFAKRSDIVRYQLIQDSASMVEVRLELNPQSDPQHTLAEVAAEMKSRFGFEVVVRNTSDFIVVGEGKFNVIVQRMKSDDY